MGVVVCLHLFWNVNKVGWFVYRGCVQCLDKLGSMCANNGKIWIRGRKVGKTSGKLVIADNIVYNRIYLEIYEKRPVRQKNTAVQ